MKTFNERRRAVNERDEANGYRVSRDPNESSNDWESLRGIDISLRRIADVLEGLYENQWTKGVER